MKENLLSFIRTHKYVTSGSAVAAIAAGTSSISAFAADPAVGGVAITSDMLSPLVEGVTANIGVVLPVGILLFSIFIGISLLPKIISKFTNK